MKSVGKIFNIKIDTETKELYVTIKITDNKFKKELIRTLDLNGKIKFDKDNIIYIGEE